jgi:glyoxylase-like metal-dependent hydrolase (beta-lactamase superfamily II)
MTLPKFQLGDFELTIVSDGVYFLDGGVFFGIVPKALWQKKMQCDESNRVVVGLNSVLVRTGKQQVLIETGIGNKLEEKPKRIFQPQAKLLENLQAAGVRPEQIDVVINSHLHFDHCGWNTIMRGGEAAPTFPNAKYYAPKGEWRVGAAQRARDRVSYISDNYDPLIRSGQMELIDDVAGPGHEIVPGIAVRTYAGHTRSMQAVLIRSGGKTACYISDLIPTSAHLDLTWGMALDLYPLETIENKRRFYKKAIPGKWLVIFTHDHAVPWAHLESEGNKVVARPVLFPPGSGEVAG